MRWNRGVAAPEHSDRTPAGGGAIVDDPVLCKALLERVPANVLVTDARYNLVYTTERAARTVRDVPVAAQQALRSGLGQLLNGVDATEATFGDAVLDVRSSPVEGPDGGTVAYVVTWEDVSERRRAERRVRDLAGRMGESEEVSADIQSVASATEELVASVREIARNASEATATVNEAVTSVEAANQTMAKLGEASAKINEIVRTITSVAEQTNLLALNATIEAARAGESGKGFAVVAGEVKELSKQTQEATEEISRMIDDVQALSQAAVQAIADISRVVARVNQNQASIAGAVEEQTSTTNEISANLAQAAQRAQRIAATLGEQRD